MIMNTLFNNNEDMEITPIGKGFGLKKINSNKFILYRQGVPDKELVFYTKLDKQIITVDLILKHGVIKRRLAEIVGVTRKTIDVWVDTYHQGGNAALVNSSKKGSGRRGKQNITRPDGNKFKEYAARKKQERAKQEATEKLQIDIEMPEKIDENVPQSDLFSDEYDWRDNRYAGSFIYWAMFQGCYKVMNLFTRLFGQYNFVMYLFLMMHVAGIPTVEQLKTLYKREFGTLTGRKCLPSHPSLWKMIHGAISLKQSCQAMNYFFKAQITKGLVSLWYLFIDGHFIGYTGKEKVHKNYHTQSREMHPGQNEMYIHDWSGCIVYFEIQEGKGDMVEVIRSKSAEYKEIMNGIPPLFVVDRELWGVKNFKYLSDCRFVTWEKNTDIKAVKSLDDKYFDKYLRINDINYQLHETSRTYKDIKGNSIELRRIVIWNTKTNTRPVAVTNDTYEDTVSIARAMLNRWGKSENSFKHMGNRTNMQYNPALDVTEKSANQRVHNPEHAKFKKEIAQIKKQIVSVERNLGCKPIRFNKDGSVRKNSSRDRLEKQREVIQDELKKLKQHIKEIPQYIDIGSSGDYQKYKVIETEGKNLWDLAGAVFWNSRKKLAGILKEYLPNERDLLPVLDATTKCKGQVKSTENRLIVRLEPLERHQFHNAQEQLCRYLNQMNVKLHNEKTLVFDVGK